jgi:hypothetical protein
MSEGDAQLGKEEIDEVENQDVVMEDRKLSDEDAFEKLTGYIRYSFL